jgi:hypothetical protein
MPASRTSHSATRSVPPSPRKRGDQPRECAIGDRERRHRLPDRPLAFFLISRIRDVTTLIGTPRTSGGTPITIALICGAYAGAVYGKSALPQDLLAGLEGREEIESTAARLYERYTTKP